MLRAEAQQDGKPMDRSSDALTAKLRTLLLELYVSGMLWRDDLSDSEQVRVLDTVLAAAEGRAFEPLGLPFPKSEDPQPALASA